jgi:hypothetical protein
MCSGTAPNGTSTIKNTPSDKETFTQNWVSNTWTPSTKSWVHNDETQ